MGFVETYAKGLSRRDADHLDGATVLEFGNAWCGHCRRAEPLLKAAFAQHDDVRHIRIADGSGQLLGRSFGVKLWPTFVFLKEGQEIARLIRPHDAAAVREAFKAIKPVQG